MAEPVDFLGANCKFNATEAMKEVGTVDLPSFYNGKSVVVCWKLSAEDLIHVLETGTIFTVTQCGDVWFPMALGTERGVKELTLDTGPVW